MIKRFSATACLFKIARGDGGTGNRAMLLTFIDSGLRESELGNLKMCDLDLEGGSAKVWKGKGGKTDA